MREVSKESFNKSLKVVIITFVFFSGFTVVKPYQDFGKSILGIPTSFLLLAGVSSILLFFTFINKDNFFLNRHIVLILITVLAPLFFSSIVMLINSFNLGPYYMDYLKNDGIIRIISLLFFISFFIMIIGNRFFYEKRFINHVVIIYLIAISFFAILGIWQLLNFYFNIPFLNIETRSFVHSIDGSKSFFKYRLTSIAEEPSYLVPLLIDGMLLSLMYLHSNKKKLVVFLFIILMINLIFSFSVSGYLDAFITFSLFNLIYIKKIKKLQFRKIKNSKLIWFLGTLFTIFIFVLIKFGFLKTLFAPVYNRITDVSGITNSIRYYLAVKPFIWLTDFDWYNILFGMGPNSFIYLSDIRYFPNGEYGHSTSTNLLTDVTFEMGIFGLFCIFILFGFLLTESYRNLLNKYSLISFMLIIHLIVSSLYRADFVSPRFWVLLLIIIFLNYLGSSEGEGERKV